MALHREPDSSDQILVVEDDYLAAEDLKDQLLSNGLNVVGPVPRVDDALTLLRTINGVSGAVLDIKLGEEMVFPVADELERLSIPFIFATSYERDILPPRHKDRPLVRKPFDGRSVLHALASRTEKLGASARDMAGNSVLALLPSRDQQKLLPLMTKLCLPRGAVLERPGVKISHVYFPLSCVASVLVRGGNLIAVETGIIGRDGLSGFGINARDTVSAFEIINQVEGDALRISIEDMLNVYDTSTILQLLTAKFVRALNIQTSYTALANARCTIPQRLSRWLLMIHDRVSVSSFTITHEYLSLMLGVRRASVTEALHVLEGERLIKSTRGVLRILNRQGLIEAAGGSYGVPEAEFRRLINADSSKPAQNVTSLFQ